MYLVNLEEEDNELDMVYDIFLSHSGAQKGFIKDLYRVLSPHYNIFLDITHHSLPPGDHFPTRIFNAAAQCRVAIVVLSEDFVCSKWPMLELCIFQEALPSITILPLFYLISPADLTNEANLKRWQSVWNNFVQHDAKFHVDASEWTRALAALRSVSGLIFNPLEGVLFYLDQVTHSISNILSPAIKCDDHLIHGTVRLRKIILEKFTDMESKEQFPSSLKACVLGLYGPPGSGKSTMSLLLRDHFFPDFRGKVLYIKLPEEHRAFTSLEMVKAFKRLLDLTDFRNRINLDKVSDLKEVISLLKAYKLPSLRVFLVVDNVSNEFMKAVRKLLELGVGPGSKVLLVARSLEVLNPALRMQGHRYICDSISMPSLLEKEAAELLLQSVGAGMGLDREAIETYRSPRHWEGVLAIVRQFGFGSKDNMCYLPSVIEKVADWLLRNNEDSNSSENRLGWFLECEKGTSKVVNFKCEAVRELLWESFRALSDPKLQLLFLDIALFILPTNIWSASEALEVLSLMHGCSKEKLEVMIAELQRSDFLRISSRGFAVRDLYSEFAHSIKEDSTMQFLGSLRRWVTYKFTDPDVGRHMLLRQDEMNNYCHVRAMVLEIGEGFKRATLNGFSSLKALVIRNCESLTELKLVGLTSLVSLDIRNCPILVCVEGLRKDPTEDSNGERRLKIWDADGYIRQGERSCRFVVR